MLTLGVADVARSTAFYESLGWRRSSASTADVTFFAMEGSVLGLFGREALAEDVTSSAAGSGFRGVTCALNCGDRDEVDAVFAAFVDAGATAVKHPDAVFWGGYSGYVADPDGHLWEIAHNPHSPNDAAGRMTLPD
jgi:catechol 2,3-dioxygenase-like lactoylglutathione lyase family enzyme